MSESTNKEIVYKSNSHIDLPIKERSRAIRNIDWERCKRKIEKLKKTSSEIYTIIYTSSMGLSASTFLNYLLMYNSREISELIKSIYIVSTFVFVAFSFIFYFLDREQKKERKKDIDDILLDMKDVEDTFPLST